MGTQPSWFLLKKEASSILVSISFVFLLPAKIVLHGIFGSYGIFGTEKSLSIRIFPSLTFFRSEISSWTGVLVSLAFFGFELSVYMGTQPPWFLLKKEASSTLVSISFIFLLHFKIVLHGIFGNFGVFCSEKSLSIRIFPSLTFFRSEISSWTGVLVSFAFLVSNYRFTWGLSHRGSF